MARRCSTACGADNRPIPPCLPDRPAARPARGPGPLALHRSRTVRRHGAGHSCLDGQTAAGSGWHRSQSTPAPLPHPGEQTGEHPDRHDQHAGVDVHRVGVPAAVAVQQGHRDPVVPGADRAAGFLAAQPHALVVDLGHGQMVPPHRQHTEQVQPRGDGLTHRPGAGAIVREDPSRPRVRWSRPVLQGRARLRSGPPGVSIAPPG